MSLMMNIGRAGAHTFQEQINASGHNIANSTTTGFKRTFNQIQDLAYFNQPAPGSNIRQGVGARGDQVSLDFGQGMIHESGFANHFAIEGAGFFGVLDPQTNQIVLTRNGVFSLNEAGQLADQNGNLVVMRTVTDQSGNVRQEPALFGPSQSTAQLTRLSNGYFQIDPADLVSNIEGNNNGLGQLHNNSLESSNVDLTDEMTNLMIAQRAYSMNMRIIQTADETKQVVNNLR